MNIEFHQTPIEWTNVKTKPLSAPRTLGQTLRGSSKRENTITRHPNDSNEPVKISGKLPEPGETSRASVLSVCPHVATPPPPPPLGVAPPPAVSATCRRLAHAGRELPARLSMGTPRRAKCGPRRRRRGRLILPPRYRAVTHQRRRQCRSLFHLLSWGLAPKPGRGRRHFVRLSRDLIS